MAEVAYEGPLVKLWHGDCMDVLPDLPRDSVDLLVTDPPYGVNWQSNYRTTAFAPIEGDDGTLDVPAVLDLAAKALRNHRHAYVFGYSPDDLASLPFGGTAELIWDKANMGMGDLGLPWGPSHERITFGVVERSKKARETKGSLSARMRQGSILRVPRPNGTRVRLHPTEKPVALMRILIESSSPVGDTVLDPFAGVGSTLVAAALLGRKAIGIEIEAQYIETAIPRIKRAEALAAEMASI